MKTVFSLFTKSWSHQIARVELHTLPQQVNTTFTKKFCILIWMVLKLNILWVINGQFVSQDLLSKYSLVILHLLLVKESLMLCSHLFWEELVLFLVPSVVEKPVFLKLYQSTLTVRLLFTSVVVKEVTKWLKSWNNSLNLLLSRMENKSVSCKEHH